MPASESYDSPDRGRGSDERDVGLLQGAMMALQREVVLMRTDFKDSREEQSKRFDSLDRQVKELCSWKDEATGGMKVARAVWTLWAFVVTTIVGLLGYWVSQK